VCVGHSLLFTPQILRALATVRSGTIGRVVSVDYLRSSTCPAYGSGPLPRQFCSAGFPFRDLGVHALYLLEAFLGPIEHVQADWKSLGGAPSLVFDEWRAQVRCRDGIGQCQLSWNCRPIRSQLIIKGTSGVLRVDLPLELQSSPWSSHVPKPVERLLNAFLPGAITGRNRQCLGLQNLLAKFYRLLREGGAAPVTLCDAKRIVQWTERVARLAEQDYKRWRSTHPLIEEVPFLVTGAAGTLARASADEFAASLSLRSLGAAMSSDPRA
jgi:predicted dehydrogenase